MPNEIIAEKKEAVPVCKRGYTHRGVRHYRLNSGQNIQSNHLEAVFAQAWEQENILKGERRSTDSPLLQLLLQKHVGGPLTPLSKELVEYDQHAAEVAATVVQWMGTNVGFGWLQETLKQAGYTVTKDKP